MDLDKAIKTRHSVRRYKTKSPNWRDIIKTIDLARLADPDLQLVQRALA